MKLSLSTRLSVKPFQSVWVLSSIEKQESNVTSLKKKKTAFIKTRSKKQIRLVEHGEKGKGMMGHAGPSTSGGQFLCGDQ